MKFKTAEYIFSGQRYWKLEEYSHKLSEGKTRVKLRKSLRKNLNTAVRNKMGVNGERELRKGLHRVVSYLQNFIFKCVYSDEIDLEKMIPETAYRYIIVYILDADQESTDYETLENIIIMKLCELDCLQPNKANQAIANNLHEIVVTVQEIIDEL